MAESTSAWVLVVDDEDAIRLTLDVLLRRRGYSVETAANADAALAKLAGKVFDLILIDLHMPGMNGLELARIVEHRYPSTAILVITGSSDLNGKPIEEQVGHFDYLLKTTSPADVLDHVTAVLSRRSESQS